MGLFEEIIKGSEKKSSAIETTLADSLKLLIEDFVKNTTEYSSNELKSESLLMSNPYFAEMLLFYDKNKKHVKRKFVKEVLEAISSIAKMIQPVFNSSLNQQNSNEKT